MYVLYERKDVFLNFYPFSLSHPLWELRAGIFTIKELWEKYLGKDVAVYSEREYIQKYIEGLDRGKLKKPGAGDIIICSNYFPDTELANKVKELKEGEGIFDQSGKMVACGVSCESDAHFDYFKKEIMNVKGLNYLFDVIDIIGEQINNEFQLIKQDNEPILEEKSSVRLVQRERMRFGKNVRIEPFVVIDASEGSVFIDDNVHVLPFSYIKGPVYIGKNTLIKSHSRIYDGVSIGKVCKVAGEIEESIILGYSNKQHDGFLGHAFIGEWVNLGALTTNSDLRNNYGNVKIRIRDEVIDTGRRFLGLLMGDHSKSGITTMFNTGTVTGFSSNIFDAGFQDKFIPSFQWGRNDIYNLNKAMETARVVMKRRNMEFTDAHRDLFEYIFELRLKEGL